MHNGHCPQTPRAERCCGNDLTVVALTRHDAAPCRVELVRCSTCGVGSWRLDGLDVTKEQALGAISAAYSKPARSSTPPTARGRRPGPAQPRPAAVPTPARRPPAEISELLAGWQVLGAQ